MSALHDLKKHMSTATVAAALVLATALAPTSVEAAGFAQQRCEQMGRDIGANAGRYAAAGQRDASQLASVLMGVAGQVMGNVACSGADNDQALQQQMRRDRERAMNDQRRQLEQQQRMAQREIESAQRAEQIARERTLQMELRQRERLMQLEQRYAEDYLKKHGTLPPEIRARMAQEGSVEPMSARGPSAAMPAGMPSSQVRM